MPFFRLTARKVLLVGLSATLEDPSGSLFGEEEMETEVVSSTAFGIRNSGDFIGELRVLASAPNGVLIGETMGDLECDVDGEIDS